MPKHYRPSGKKKEGNVARYVTRSQAVKYLQISLSHFRKLCIFKGVFPREPKKKVKGNHHTYYHMKDILFLKHEPLLEKFREMKSYERKVKKAISKKNSSLAEQLLTRKPTYNLTKPISERYPRFIDALRDLDECLTMVHLFAALPAVEREKIEVKHIHNCRRLSYEWQAYISRTHKLRKTFVSVKGIYYQAEIEGQIITWLTPHDRQQVLPDDVDYKVLLTFAEFDEALLEFVNRKLYQSMNINYPPIIDTQFEASASDLYALSRYFDANSKASTIESEHNALMQLTQDSSDKDEDDINTKECKNLLKDMKFFLSREAPMESLLFVIPAFGGVVSFEETDQNITHQIVDRPTQGHKFLSREYVQPQWIYDCVNFRFIFPIEDYIVGRVPPPHLSPFIDNEAENYIPEHAETIKRLQAVARKEILPMPGVEDDSENILVEGIIDRAEAIEASEKKQKMSLLEKQYHNELQKELQASSGLNLNSRKTDEDESGPDMDQIDLDEDTLAKSMMSRKKRKLLEAMEIGKRRKKDEINLLKERKRKIDEAK